MKNLLFVLSLCLPLSATAMNFSPLTEEELPKKNYTLHMTSTTDVSAEHISYGLPVRAIELNTKEIEVTYNPYSNPTLLLPVGIPMDMTWFVMSFVSGQPIPSSLDLSMESKVTSINTGEIIGKQVTKVALSVEELKEGLSNTMQQVQAEGNKKVLEKNRDLFSWTKSFLSELPEWGQNRKDEEHFINATRMLSYCFSGKIQENLDENTFLKAEILGASLKLEKKSAFNEPYLYNLAKVAIFRKFLQDMGFYLEGNRLKIKK